MARRRRNAPAKLLGREKITRKDYPGVFGDTDRDKFPDADDPHPQIPGDTESVEEIQLSDEIGALIDTRSDYVKVMRDIKRDLQKVGGKGAKVKGRVKTPYSVINKLRRKRLDTLTDMAGTMLVVPDQKAVEKARKEIERKYEVLDFDNYYATPLGGYRAYHFVVEQDGKPVEIQLKTERMSKIGSASHTAYKTGELSEKVLTSLTALALKADKGDKKAAKEIDALLEDKKRLTQMLTTDKYDELVLNPGDLPEDPWRYFKKTARVKLLPISALEPIRARPKGIKNARKYMRLAYDGKYDKRKPISVQAVGGGRYKILDGNSTYAVAKASGWKRIPVEVERAANPLMTEAELVAALKF